MAERKKFYIPYGEKIGTLFYGVESDSVDVYLSWLKEIPRLPLEEEERLHIQKKAAGDRVDFLKKVSQENEVYEKAYDRWESINKNLRNRIANSNLGLVAPVANLYYKPEFRVSPLELIQEGNIGLMVAAERYDPNKEVNGEKVKFSTYAPYWIRQSIFRAISNASRIIRLPEYAGAVLTKTGKIADRKTQEKGRELNRDDLLEIGREIEVDFENFFNILQMSGNLVSLETPVGEEGKDSLSDFIADENAESPYDDVLKTLVKKQLLEQLCLEMDLAGVNPKQRIAILVKYGLLDGQTKTLDQAGKVLKLTREAVRLREQGGLKKLRNPGTLEQLEPFLD